MTNSIKQVLEMNKAGTLTDEQAEALIREITREQQKADDSPQADPTREAPPRYDRRWDHAGFSSFAHTTVRKVFDQVADSVEDFSRAHNRTAEGNDLQLSHIDPPTGSDYIFRGNRIRMSKLSELELLSSEFSGNKADASKLAEIRLSHARMSNCDIKASALVELSLDRSEIASTEIFSSKAGEVSLLDESAIRNSRIHASVLKECRFEAKSLIQDTRIDCSAWAEVALKASSVTSSEFSESKAKELLLERSSWKNVIARDVAMGEVRLSDSHFDNVLVSATECWGWKKRGWSKVRIENTTLENVGFVDCRLHDVTIRDVNVSNIRIQGLVLDHQTIVGNDAFLKAVESFRK